MTTCLVYASSTRDKPTGEPLHDGPIEDCLFWARTKGPSRYVIVREHDRAMLAISPRSRQEEP